MYFERTPCALSVLVLVAAVCAAATTVHAQTIYFSKDYITDDNGRVIATATPLPADQIAPTAPSNLNASNVTYTSATLQWTASTDSGGSGLAGYLVYRGNVPVASVASTSFTDVDLQPYGSYQYRIVAIDGAGNLSGPSNTISVTSAPVPNAPSNLVATVISSSQINLSWTDNSSDESGFKIERKTGTGGVWSQIDTVGANVTAYPNTGLSGSTTYYYRVRAYGPGGDSAYSNEASATTPAPQPTSMVISPSSLRQGECYTFTVGNGANMTLDVQYTLNGGPPQQINGWPALNGNGQHVECTNWQTAVGTYTFVYMRNRLNTNWVPISAPVTVLPAQPTSFSVSPGTVYQGECYTMAAGNATYMTLDVQYTFNGGPVQTLYGWPNMNQNGQDSICTDQFTALGTYTFVAVRNTLNTDWVPVYAPLTVLPPQPTSFSVYPSVIVQGQCYTMTAGNAAYMTLDVQYTFNGGPPQTLYGWPNMDGNGQNSICTDANTPIGTYTFVAVRNTLNTAWVSVYASVTVTAP